MKRCSPYIRAEVKRGMLPAPIETEAFGEYAIASSMGLIPGGCGSSHFGPPDDIRIPWTTIAIVQRTGTM